MELPRFRGHVPIIRKDVNASRRTYTPQYSAHVVALARRERSAESVAREFESTGQTVREWVPAADAVDQGPAAHATRQASGNLIYDSVHQFVGLGALHA